MSMDLYTFGDTRPIRFKLTKDRDAVTGYVLLEADVQLQKDDGAWVGIGTACTESGNGWYKWSPASSTDTSAKTLTINIKDSVGTTFDENGMVLQTGDNALAAF